MEKGITSQKVIYCCELNPYTDLRELGIIQNFYIRALLLRVTTTALTEGSNEAQYPPSL